MASLHYDLDHRWPLLKPLELKPPSCFYPALPERRLWFSSVCMHIATAIQLDISEQSVELFDSS